MLSFYTNFHRLHTDGGVNFDVKVFNNIYMNVAILQYKTDIAYTCCKQLTSTVLSIYPSPF